MDKTCGTCEYYYACDEGSWDKDNHALDENAPGCENWEQPNQPVDLHSQIMNIPVDADKMQLAVEEASKECTWVRQMEYLYKLAHRDARHAAAELVAGRWRKVEL